MACFKICIRSRRNDGLYSLQSLANGASDDLVNKALLVTFATNAAGDSDLSGETISCSRFPVGFHDKVLFAGRAFPKHDFEEDAYSGEGGLSNHGKYATSFTNYVNVALMSLLNYHIYNFFPHFLYLFFLLNHLIFLQYLYL